MKTTEQSWIGYIVLSACVFAWYLFGFDLGVLDYDGIFEKVDSNIKVYFILIIYTLWTIVLTHNYYQNKNTFKYFYFSAIGVFFFNITLILPSIIHYDRIDFIVSICAGSLAGYFLKEIRSEVEKLILSITIKNPIWKYHIVIMFLLTIYILVLYTALFLYSKEFLFINNLLFLLTVLIVFVLTIPKNILFSPDEKENLKDQFSAFHYKQKLNKMGFDDQVVHTQQEALVKIQENTNLKQDENKPKMRSKTIISFNFLFDKNQKHATGLESETDNPEEVVVINEIYDPKNGNTLKTINIRLKHLLIAFEDIKVHITDMKLMPKYLNILLEKAIEYAAIEIENPKKMLFGLIHSNNLELLKYFFSIHQINLNYIDDETGYTPLLFSVVQSSHLIVELLLEKGANPEIGNKLGIVPIGFAARYGKIDDCRLLLSYGANVNHCDTYYKYTPLINASIHGHVDVVEFLLSNGANPQARDSEGKCAIDHAEENGYGKIAALLRKTKITTPIQV